ncbi:MAG TPA: hypothetical protein VKR54_03445 [Candidatus Babeliales bacterium]|nr:hypothetical protein [Candidatus Babeliales bacterium]
MKKILSTALVAVALSIAMVSTISAKKITPRTRKAQGGRPGTAQRLRVKAKKVEVSLKTAEKVENPAAREQIRQTANQLARELLKDLQERSWSGDLRGYTEEQIKAAGDKYTNLEIQRTQLMRDIETKQGEIDAMSKKSMFWGRSAEAGKEEALKIAMTELKEYKSTLNDVNKAMRDQQVIAGKEYCGAIKMAIGALTATTIAGLTYGIDKYKYEGAGMKRLGESYASMKSELAMEEGEGYGAYVKRGASKAYGVTASKVSDMKTYAGNKITALKDYVSQYWNPSDKPKEVSEAEKAAVKARQEANAAEKKSEQNPDNKTLEITADTKENEAVKQEENLEAVVNDNLSEEGSAA